MQRDTKDLNWVDRIIIRTTYMAKARSKTVFIHWRESISNRLLAATSINIVKYEISVHKRSKYISILYKSKPAILFLITLKHTMYIFTEVFIFNLILTVSPVNLSSGFSIFPWKTFFANYRSGEGNQDQKVMNKHFIFCAKSDISLFSPLFWIYLNLSVYLWTKEPEYIGVKMHKLHICKTLRTWINLTANWQESTTIFTIQPLNNSGF